MRVHKTKDYEWTSGPVAVAGRCLHCGHSVRTPAKDYSGRGVRYRMINDTKRALREHAEKCKLPVNHLERVGKNNC